MAIDAHFEGSRAELHNGNVVERPGHYRAHTGHNGSIEVILLAPATIDVSGYRGRFYAYGPREIVDASSIGFTGFEIDARLIHSNERVRKYYLSQAELFKRLAKSGRGHTEGLLQLEAEMREKADKYN